VQIGETIEKEIDPSHLGRIAAQAAKQAIVQRIRQFEKDRLYDDFKSSIGDIVSGVVRRRDRSDLVIDLGKTEAILPAKERIPGEEYVPGDRIRCLLLNIESTPRGPELILTRSHPNFVKRLFELEVSEIADGTVTIESIARESGYRTKITVQTHDPKVDPVGACVGARGARVKTIVRELGGEKIDIIRYFSDPRKMLEEAISPAVPKNIRVDEANRRIYFEVAEGDLSIAIGRKGQNAKLTSKLLGWRLDIGKENSGEVQFEERLQRAVEGINQIPGISDDEAQVLVNNGITSIEAFEGVNVSDLVDLGFTESQANNIIAKVKAFRKH
jgi:N utilization substance protein A